LIDRSSDVGHHPRPNHFGFPLDLQPSECEIVDTVFQSEKSIPGEPVETGSSAISTRLSFLTIRESFRLTCGSERTAPECSTQRCPAATPHVGQGTEDDCFGLRLLFFIPTMVQTFVNIRPSFSRSAGCRRARLRNDWQLCDSSTSRLSRKPGASRRRPTQKKHFTFLRSSAERKSRDSPNAEWPPGAETNRGELQFFDA
jgi:hypothetical protein